MDTNPNRLDEASTWMDTNPDVAFPAATAEDIDAAVREFTTPAP